MPNVPTHLCPPSGSSAMPCCGLPPFEVREHRMTLDPALVTCWTGDDPRFRPDESAD